MNGTAELLELARLLRLGAATGLRIGELRSPGDKARLQILAVQAEALAADLEALAAPSQTIAVEIEAVPKH